VSTTGNHVADLALRPVRSITSFSTELNGFKTHVNCILAQHLATACCSIIELQPSTSYSARPQQPTALRGSACRREAVSSRAASGDAASSPLHSDRLPTDWASCSRTASDNLDIDYFYADADNLDADHFYADADNLDADNLDAENNFDIDVHISVDSDNLDADYFYADADNLNFNVDYSGWSQIALNRQRQLQPLATTWCPAEH